MPTIHTIEAAVHGRYLVEPAADPQLVLVGFHGYAENAHDQLARLVTIPGAERCVIVSIQGLHRFYHRRTQRVIASWMTREDREFAIADNVAYVNRVIDEVTKGQADLPLVFTGFSQGVAMAFRAACAAVRPVGAVVAMGGDVPPELESGALGRIPRALLGRGTHDEWYTEVKHAADASWLRTAGVEVTALPIEAGHEWTDAFSADVARFLRLVP